MQLTLTTPLPLTSTSQALLTRRLLPLYIAVFSQGLVLWAPIEKVFLRSLGFDQTALGLLLDSFCALRADLWGGEPARGHFLRRMDGGGGDAVRQRAAGQRDCRPGL